MMQPRITDPGPRRAYHSPRRRNQAQATRAAIATAARELFLARGWSGTTVREVAARAGVGEATVYAAYRSKAGLARALVDAVDIAADVAGSAQDVLDADPDPRAQLAFMISIDRRLFEHDGNLIAMLQDSRAEPELRAAYDRGRARADQIHRGVFNSWPGHWFRAGMGAADAADTYAALCNIGVYQVLTGERGWTADQVQDWWHDSLSCLLLTGTPPPAGPPAERPPGRSQ
jgi:TetR/AcrR family transcriptional regulator, regulator of cefoperazone and chloramphenicol sensitivity